MGHRGVYAFHKSPSLGFLSITNPLRQLCMRLMANQYPSERPQLSIFMCEKAQLEEDETFCDR